MRPHGKNIDMFPDDTEVLHAIGEHEELKATERISRAIQQILDV